MPEIQVAEVIREEPNFREEIITKEIPRVQMEYIEKVEEIYDRVEQTSLPVGLQSRQTGFRSRGVAVETAGVGLAGVEYVTHAGVQLPFFADHHLQTLHPTKLREHAMLLYRTLGHQVIGNAVPLSDAELFGWIMNVQRTHLGHLRTIGYGQSTVTTLAPTVTEVRETVIPEVVQTVIP